MSKIMETKHYEWFSLHAFNRDVRKTKHLERSMLKHGWIDAYPAHVIKKGGDHNRYILKAGHHRFVVAQSLGLPIKFVACEDMATIPELETATTAWTLSNYLESYCQLGKPAYLEVRAYCEKTGIPLMAAISMLAGEGASSGNQTAKFKNGEYVVEERSHADAVASVVLQMKECGIQIAATKTMVYAISRALMAPEISPAQVIHKITQHHHMVQKCPSLGDYMRMLEEVYNRHSQNKIPLVFLADEAARKRNPKFASRYPKASA